MPLVTVVLSLVAGGASVTPIAGKELFAFGVQPGTALGGVPEPSVPFTWYGAEFAPWNWEMLPLKVRADGKFNPKVTGATTYCISFCEPLGMTASAVTSNTCRVFAEGVSVRVPACPVALAAPES